MESTSHSWRRVSLYAPLIVWIGVIFYLSGFGGSFETTSKFIGPMLRLLFPDAGPETLATYHFYVRKSAHFVAYAILATLAYRAFDQSSRRSAAALVTVAVVACLDETNQAFNVKRTGSPMDVLLDLSGGVAALAAILALKRRKTQP